MKKPFTRGEKITISIAAIGFAITIIGWGIKESGGVQSFFQMGGQTAGIINNNFTPPAPPPEDPIEKAHSKIDSLSSDQDIDTFKTQVGPVFTTNKLWGPTSSGNNMPPQTEIFDEYIFRGSLSSDPSSHDYYIQAITPDNSSNVSFWSMTICNPNITFPITFPSASITDPAAKRIVTLNQSTFGDIFKVTDNYLPETFSGDTMLYYSPQGESGNIYETQNISPAAGHRLYVGVNNSCQYFAPDTFGRGDYYFPFVNASGTREPNPKYLEDALKFSGLSDFRQTTRVNTIGMSGRDESFYWWLKSNNPNQASVGYDFLTSPDSN